MKPERISTRTPAFDCILHPCGRNGCGTYPGSNHGRHSEEWRYIVRTEDVALSLLVYSGFFLPETVRTDPSYYQHEKPRGAGLHLHLTFPVDREDLRLSRTMKPCDALAGGRCFAGDSFTHYKYDPIVVAMTVSDPVQARDFDQPESFWKVFEGVFDELFEKVQFERVDTDFERCPACDGLGTVAKGHKVW